MEKEVISKDQCPVNQDVEVEWHFGENNVKCSYSGHKDCEKCIEEKDYPKK